MRNATEKQLDMARSILPCKHRRASRRDLARTKRAGRRRANQDLGAMPPGSTIAGVEDTVALRPTPYPSIDVNGLRNMRQGSDKLNHFERWAVAITRDLPVEDRLGHVRGLLPRGLVGDHAMAHLRRVPELGGERWRRSPRVPANRTDAARSLVWRGIHRALEDGTHGDLNRAMKAAPVGDPPRTRVLAGRHDAIDFFLDVWSDEVWWCAVLAHLRPSPR